MLNFSDKSESGDSVIDNNQINVEPMIQYLQVNITAWKYESS